MTGSVCIPLITAPYVTAAGEMVRANLRAGPLIDNCIAEACADGVIVPFVNFNHICSSRSHSRNATLPAGSQGGG